ncbi:MAG TPA: hypothetical protein VFZ53_04255 [Polyangiaceae bacterium]
MNHIDALYGGFVNTLPEDLRELAVDLPFVLGLAPAKGIPWSEVFTHPVTLGAPALIAEAFPRIGPDIVRNAQLGHALSVIEAFGTDRALDGQIQPSPQLFALLEHFRTARCEVLEQVWPGCAREAREADRTMRIAIHEEHTLLSQIGPATFDEYRRISLGKQSVGFTASVALARAAGATASQVEEVRRALSGVWLGLQFEDDAADWEDDWRRGHGAWAVSLARRRLEAVREQRSEERPTEPDLIRRRVFNMRVLYSMLVQARHHYRKAARYSRVLGAGALATWANKRTARLDEILPNEDRHAGYVVRARKLAAWAAEVLS